MSAAALCLLAILANVRSTEAGPGLRGQPPPRQMNRTDVETHLLSELSSMFRDGEANKHISSLEVELSAMYTAMPKDGDGLLGHTVVRYMLHRFFVQKHSWFIRGLEPGNASALAAVTEAVTGQKQTTGMLDWVPSYLQKFVEEMHDGRGLNLRELAVLAATLEDLIHKESNQRLEMTFTALELPFSTMLNQQQMRSALEVYMMIYQKGGSFRYRGDTPKAQIMHAHDLFAKKYKDWGAVQEWMHSIQVEVMPGSAEKPLDFMGASRVVEEVGRRYSTYFEAECRDLRSELLKIESTKAGRIRLSDYYKQGLSGSGVVEFNEKIEFLRALGVIDDSSGEPHVLVPNYLTSRPNCVRASNFYVVCCRDECEDLMSAIEKKFETPTASPAQILGLVATLSTATVQGPRTLPDTLVGRLNSIAEANEGKVPLHGRLFAQWLHHAFPRECPYPQKADAVAPLTADESTGPVSAEATDEEMQLVVDRDDCTESRWKIQCCLRKLPVGEKAREHQLLPENELPWDDSEELLHPTKKAPSGVVTLKPPVQKEPSRMALISFIFLAGVALAWKLTLQNKKSAGWQDGLLV